MNQKVMRILLFYSIGLAFSYVFRIASPAWFENLTLPYGLAIIKDWIGGFGPFLGAVLVMALFRLPRKISFTGSSPRRSWLMLLVPLILFTIFGAQNDYQVNSHLYGFFVGVVLVVYCLLEETGWRGYLQDELRGLHPALRYSLVGLLWYAWHLSFLNGSVSFLNELTILLILIAASWGLGQVAESTRSIMAAACLHMIGNILAFSSFVKRSLPLNHRLIIIGICIAFWIVILIRWDSKDGKRASE